MSFWNNLKKEINSMSEAVNAKAAEIETFKADLVYKSSDELREICRRGGNNNRKLAAHQILKERGDI